MEKMSDVRCEMVFALDDGNSWWSARYSLSTAWFRVAPTHVGSWPMWVGFFPLRPDCLVKLALEDSEDASSRRCIGADCEGRSIGSGTLAQQITGSADPSPGRPNAVKYECIAIQTCTLLEPRTRRLWPERKKFLPEKRQSHEPNP